MSRVKSISNRGFTLVELMIVVAIIGVLAALAVVGVRRYLTASKTAEAKQAVGAIARNATVQYERERAPSEIILPTGSSSQSSHILCDSATPVPAGVAAIRGTKYQPSTALNTDFNSGTSLSGWQCLSFSITTPIYFQYHYQVGGGYFGSPPPAGPVAFEAAARGDLDGDGVLSTFTRSGEVRKNGAPINPGEIGVVVLSTNIYIDNETE